MWDASCDANVVCRGSIGPVQNPVRGLLHGSAALIGLVLASRSSHLGGEAIGRNLFLTFCLGHSALFAISSTYHSGPWSERWKRRMQRLDHSMIYVAIASTLTPLAFLSTDDWRRFAVLIGAWGLASCGIAQKLFLPGVHHKACVPFQLAQAMLVLLLIGPFASRHPGAPIQLLALGMVCYGLGVVIFLTQRPQLWPRWFSFHEVFHVLVVGGSAAYTALMLGTLTSPG